MGWKFVRTLRPAGIIVTVEGKQVMGWLQRHTQDKCQIHVWDTKYHLTTKAEMEQFVRWDATNMTKGEPEFHDCDDYAVRLWGRNKEWTHGLAFGLMLIPGHAMNFCIDIEWNIWAVEPSNDSFKPWKPKYPTEEITGYRDKALEIFI